MANSDFIPTNDAVLKQFSDNLSATIGVVAGGEGSLGDQNAALNAKAITFQQALIASENGKTTQRSLVTTKNTARAALVENLRTVARLAKADPAVSPAVLADAGITVDRPRTTAVPAPTSRPVLTVDHSQRLKHVVSFRDENGGSSKAKPVGALGCKIFRKIGTVAPTSANDCTFLGMDSASPFDAMFDAGDAGKSAFYIGVWTARSGADSPESAVVSATIVG
jgi:hypothetical protein